MIPSPNVFATILFGNARQKIFNVIQNNQYSTQNSNHMKKLCHYKKVRPPPKILSETEPLGSTGVKPWKDGDSIKSKEPPSISFSHRAVALRVSQGKWEDRNSRYSETKIHYRPKVYKLVPSRISQSIAIRSKLDKLMPKKNLQPILYSRSSLRMQRQLRPIVPCDNYRNSSGSTAENVKTKKLTEKEVLKEKRETSASRRTYTRSVENSPETEASFIEYAKGYYKSRKDERAIVPDLASPLKYLLRYAKNLAKAMKSGKE